VRDEWVNFYSEGLKIEALLRRPDGDPPPGGYPVILQGPGYIGLAESPISKLYNEVFCKAGFAVIAPNFRGYGNSEGEKGWILPDQQIVDMINTLTYVETVRDFDARRIGCYGHGGTGGGNAIMLAGMDDRVRAVAVQSPVADGITWLRSMRRHYEWLAYVERIEEHRRQRVLTGKGEIVNPREEIMVATPQRRAEATRNVTDKRLGDEFQLASVEHMLRYRPIDYIERIAPRPVFIIALKRDVVTPEDLGAEALYAKAKEPKYLLRQNEALSHYRSYETNLDLVGGELVKFYQKHLTSAPVTLVATTAAGVAATQIDRS
jgi:pimeloyl-ACP methyl ester carboxylesterase